MGVFSVTLKTHSRDNITHQFPELNNCVVHNCAPKIFKSVVGRRKETFYTAICVDDDCGKISMESAEDVVAHWNKWNPKQTLDTTDTTNQATPNNE